MENTKSFNHNGHEYSMVFSVRSAVPGPRKAKSVVIWQPIPSYFRDGVRMSQQEWQRLRFIDRDAEGI